MNKLTFGIFFAWAALAQVSQYPDTVTNISGNAATATALAADPANCSAGNYPLGIAASGAVQSCTAAPTPGGSTTQLQYNNAGAFGGMAGNTWNGSSISLSSVTGADAVPTAANSGLFNVASGNGGAAAGGGGANQGGSANGVYFFGGDGGAATGGASNAGGNGGAFVFTLGTGGSGASSNGLDGVFQVVQGGYEIANIQEWQSNGTSLRLAVNPSGMFVAGSANTPPVVSGCTAAAIVAGSKGIAGQINGTPNGACAVTLTFPFAAPTGWNCAISNLTTANLIRQTASTTTTAVFTGVTVANDVLAYGPCVGW